MPADDQDTGNFYDTVYRNTECWRKSERKGIAHSEEHEQWMEGDLQEVDSFFILSLDNFYMYIKYSDHSLDSLFSPSLYISVPLHLFQFLSETSALCFCFVTHLI